MRRRLAGVILITLVSAVGVVPAHARGAGHSRPGHPATATTSFVVLRRGSTGVRVRQLQIGLRAFGYVSVGADGLFGPRTQTAVKRFQRTHHLVADGVVAHPTWQALGLDKPSAPPAKTAKPPKTTTTTTTTTTTLPPIRSGAYTHPNPNVERWHRVALAVGWGEEQWTTLSCIIQRESKGNPAAWNHSGAMGLLQILWSAHASWIGGAASQLLDGRTNLRIGRQLYARDGWSPWRAGPNGC